MRTHWFLLPVVGLISTTAACAFDSSISNAPATAVVETHYNLVWIALVLLVLTYLWIVRKNYNFESGIPKQKSLPVRFILAAGARARTHKRSFALGSAATIVLASCCMLLFANHFRELPPAQASSVHLPVWTPEPAAEASMVPTGLGVRRSAPKPIAVAASSSADDSEDIAEPSINFQRKPAAAERRESPESAASKNSFEADLHHPPDIDHASALSKPSASVKEIKEVKEPVSSSPRLVARSGSSQSQAAMPVDLNGRQGSSSAAANGNQTLRGHFTHAASRFYHWSSHLVPGVHQRKPNGSDSTVPPSSSSMVAPAANSAQMADNRSF